MRLRDKIRDAKLRDVILYIYHKAFFQVLRGMIVSVLFKKRSGLFFLGKGSVLRFTHQLSVGRDCYIGDYVYMDCMSKGGVELGDRVTIREFGWMQLSSSLSNLGESIVIGSNTYIGPRSSIGAAGPVVVGQNCQFGAGLNIIAEAHNYVSAIEKISDQGVTRKGVNIGDDCWFGNNVIVLDGVSIGKGVVIGAGAVVTRDIEDFSVAVGVPAKVISRRNVS